MATYYVATVAGGGNDSRTPVQAQSILTPWLTLTHAVPFLAAGDTLFVRAGTYNESLVNNIPSGSSWANKVRIAQYQSEVVWLAPTSGNHVLYLDGNQQYIEFDGIGMDGTVGIAYGPVKLRGWTGGNPHHIRIQNATVKGGLGALAEGRVTILVLAETTGLLGSHEFLKLNVQGVNATGAYATGIYLQTSNSLVSGCQVHQVRGTGIWIHNPNTATVPNANTVTATRVFDVVGA